MDVRNYFCSSTPTCFFKLWDSPRASTIACDLDVTLMRAWNGNMDIQVVIDFYQVK